MGVVGIDNVGWRGWLVGLAESGISTVAFVPHGPRLHDLHGTRGDKLQALRLVR